MVPQASPAHKWFAALIALFGWFAVGFQFYLMLQNRTAPVPETVVRFFSFFTILTNLLTAICFTQVWRNAGSARTLFFTKASTLAALTVYMVVVGLVYNAILRFTWAPQGWQRVVDELLHLVQPLLVLLYWIFIAPKRGLAWRGVFAWLLYPAAYLAFILLRGAAAHFYPYPFVNVDALGYANVLFNCVLLFGGFLFLSVVLVAVSRRLAQRV